MFADQGSHLSGAKIGPQQISPLGAGHVPWGKPPWTLDVDRDITRIEGQPGDCVLFTERLVHTTVPWTGRGERRSIFVKYVPYGARCHLSDVCCLEQPEITSCVSKVATSCGAGALSFPVLIFAGLHYTDRRYDTSLPGLVRHAAAKLQPCRRVATGIHVHALNVQCNGSSVRNHCLRSCRFLRGWQTEQQRQVLSYPDNEKFLNVARNPRSPFYRPDQPLGEWRELPASATLVPKL